MEIPDIGTTLFASIEIPDNGTALFASIEIPDNGTALFASIFPVNPVDVYYVYLKYDGFPNETYYDWVGVIPNPELDDTDPKRFVYAPPQNYTSVNGTYRIGIRLKGPSLRICFRISPLISFRYLLIYVATICPKALSTFKRTIKRVRFSDLRF